MIDFDRQSKELNNELDKFIKKCIFDIDELRQEDEKNKHIIRQLFKAYYNNCFQIKGQYFKDFISSLQSLKDNLLKNEKDKNVIIKYSLIFQMKFYDKDNDYINTKELQQFIYELKYAAEIKNPPETIWKLYIEFIEKICFYIASMTDDYALSSYQYLYGIK